MQKIGIIAFQSERTPLEKRWWQFWVKRDDFEVVEFLELNLEAIIVYIPDHYTDSHTAEAMDFFSFHGIKEPIYSRCIGIKSSKKELLKSFTIPAIHKRAKNLGLDSRNFKIAYMRNHTNITELIQLAQICKFITIITKDKKSAQLSAEKIFSETGLPVLVTDSIKESYDFILSENGFENLEIKLTSKTTSKIKLSIKIEEEELVFLLWKLKLLKVEDIDFILKLSSTVL